MSGMKTPDIARHIPVRGHTIFDEITSIVNNDIAARRPILILRWRLPSQMLDL